MVYVAVSNVPEPQGASFIQAYLDCISIRGPAQRDGDGLALDPLLEGGQLGRRPLDGHGGQVRPRLGLSAEGRSSAAAGGGGEGVQDGRQRDGGQCGQLQAQEVGDAAA